MDAMAATVHTVQARVGAARHGFVAQALRGLELCTSWLSHDTGRSMHFQLFSRALAAQPPGKCLLPSRTLALGWWLSRRAMRFQMLPAQAA